MYDNIDGTLYIDGCSSLDLVKKYETPMYLISETQLRNRCGELRNDFLNKYENTRVAYAAKVFSSIAIFQIMDEEGFCVDVVTGGELYTCLKAGFPAERIEFNGNNKSVKELEMAVDNNVGRIIVDNTDELEVLEEICKEKNKKMNVLYRITPGTKSNTHAHIDTGQKDSKFGIALNEEIIYPAIEKGIKSDHLNFKGLHFHVGSQLLDNASHLQAIETSLNLLKETKERFGYVMEELNVGGGFGIKYTEEDELKPFNYFLDPVMERVEAFSQELGIKRPAIVTEPGRSMMGGSAMLYTIGAVKEIPNIRKYVAVDGGMSDNLRPAMYSSKYEGAVANKMNEKAEEKVTICGKCCESGDVIIKDFEGPKLERGDIFAVFSTAYCYSLASNYNKNPIPPTIMLKDGESKVIVKRQSYEDLTQYDISLR